MDITFSEAAKSTIQRFVDWWKQNGCKNSRYESDGVVTLTARVRVDVNTGEVVEILPLVNTETGSYVHVETGARSNVAFRA